MVRATEVLLRFIGTRPTLRRTHSAYIQTRQVPRRFQRGLVSSVLVPSIWFPFHPFPFTHFCFLFSFMSSCLHVWSSHPFLRLRAHWSRPECVRALLHTFKHRFQVAQVFTMRWASSGVPVHLVPLSFQPHAPLSRQSSCHVFILLSLVRAHAHIGPHLSLRLPSGRRVCVPLVIAGIPLNCFFSFSAGGASSPSSLAPTKTLDVCW